MNQPSRGSRVMTVLNATDDHLQLLQHYAASHDLRSVLGTVSEMLELLIEARTGAFDANPIAHSNWLARVESVTDKAVGGAS